MAAPNFVFLDGAFSYEPLALPLAVVAAYGVARWLALKEAGPGLTARRGGVAPAHAWAVVIVLTTASVVITHHVTSYLLIIFFLAVGRAQREIRRTWKSYVSPFPFAAFALLAAFIWLLFAARSTWNYLTPVLSDAVKSSIDIISGHQHARQLFSNQQDVTPISDRILAFSAAGLAALGIPFGLMRVWKNQRTNPVALVLGVAAAAYVVSLGLRLVPAAWETANRASEFLFLGVALVLALIGVDRWRPRAVPFAGQLAVGVAFGVMVEGGMVAGWSSNIMLARRPPVKVGNATIHTRRGTQWRRGPRRRSGLTTALRPMPRTRDCWPVTRASSRSRDQSRRPVGNSGTEARRLARPPIAPVRDQICPRRQAAGERGCARRLLLHERDLTAVVVPDLRSSIRPQVRPAAGG